MDQDGEDGLSRTQAVLANIYTVTAFQVLEVINPMVHKKYAKENETA